MDTIPYWTISAEFEIEVHIIKANYCRQKVETLSEATSIVRTYSSQDGRVTEIRNQKNFIFTPYPFNLADLQKKPYRIFKLSPSYTLSIFEKLYTVALISYPRTSSQKLPPSTDYGKIISDLSKITLSLAPKYGGNSSEHASGVSIDSQIMSQFKELQGTPPSHYSNFKCHS